MQHARSPEPRRTWGSHDRRQGQGNRRKGLDPSRQLFEGSFIGMPLTHAGETNRNLSLGDLDALRDLAEFKQLELDRERIAGLYAALSQANKAIVHATDEAGLFQQVCRVCVEFIHLDLAYIGRPDSDGTHLEVATATGPLTGYLAGLHISLALDGGADSAPAGRCLSGLGEQICQDWSRDPVAEAGRERALAFGIRSNAAFPLSCEGQVTSVLNLYSTVPGFFSPDRLELLREIVGDSSFALDRFAREAHRQQAEEAFRATFEQAAVGITHVSLEGTFLKLNRKFSEMVGYSEAELLGHLDLEITEPESRAEDSREIQALVMGSRPSSCWEKRYLRKEGEPIWVRVTLALLHDQGGSPTHFVYVVEDLTSERRADAQRQELVESLHQAQKMDSLGTLSAGIAHDMNNVLAGIMGTAEVMKITCGPEGKEARHITTIIRASERGRDLVKNLTAFARKGLKESRLLDLNELVQNEIELLSRTTLQKITVHADLGPRLPRIMGEPSAISSALMNLCVNAVHAMPDGGSLTIRTTRLPDQWVELVVTDTGQGMSPNVLAKATEPFFTTKPLGKGTGLGLAMAFAVMKAHGGTLDISSEPGKGTAVTLRFPEGSGDQDPSVHLPLQKATPQASIKVLIVDDDDEFLAVVPQLVSSLGHATAIARRGQEALDQLEGGLEVDLVILDQNMPGLTGTETLKRLRERWPLLPVILGTGFLDASAAADVATHHQVRVLHKPYTLLELRQAIDGLMAGVESPRELTAPGP